ncbi:M23 family metallopeptidase [Sphingomicrobium sediminis]|uniref:M23 family metallopeptidase n=1 Tax=Sphingomicrobium sediminis TaxID=2950949 RepID=A0A9X2EM70_9SPHN|nr:M23 family metallopeptidase [Sphingomicrobium sediminis]MCM8557974.1 M23 family metallopeptidase [Sphingomicrobium sediminis]
MSRNERKFVSKRSPRRIAGVGAVLLGVAALALGAAPLSKAFADDRAPTPGPDLAAELTAAGISNGTMGRLTGRRMAASEKVSPLREAPVRPWRELVATVGVDGGLESALRRAGVPRADAASATRAVHEAAGGRIGAGTKVNIRLGPPGPGDVRPLESLSMRAALDLDVSLDRAGDVFNVTRERIAVKASPMRIRGRVGNGLYFAMRDMGVTPRAAQDYLKALGAHVDVGDVSPDDMFDLVIEHRETASGDHVAGPLLYAGLDRRGASDVALLKWTAGGREQWLDALSLEGKSEGLIWPVQARISGYFGMRTHPILRIRRMHKGMDFAARTGTPIRAAADGRVIKAGWNGGAGRMITIQHEGGLRTRYFHMSGYAVSNGATVRQGQVIGYVGSSGLSTGAHLHYEVHQNGRAVDPRGVRMVRRPVLEGNALTAFQARYDEYMALPRTLPVG